MGERDQLGARRQQARQCIQVDAALDRHGDHVELDAGARPQELPRHDVRMVFELRQQDAVARLQQRTVGIGDEIDRRRAAAGEHDLQRRHAEECRHLDTRILVGLGRPLGQAMHAAQHVGAFGGLIDAHRVEHGIGRLRRGAVVEIMNRLAVDDLGQDGELPADGGDVEAHAGLRSRQAANASGVSMSVTAASPAISTSQTRSPCSPIRCLAPVSPASLAISGKKRRAPRTGLPPFPTTVGTQIERPSTGLKAAIRRSSSPALTPGMSPSCTTAASTLLLSAPMPVRTEVLRPSAKSGFVTKRSRDLAGTAFSMATRTSSAMCPSTTTTSTACEASAALTAWTTSGWPLASDSILFGPPMRVEQPPATPTTATPPPPCCPSPSPASPSRASAR